MNTRFTPERTLAIAKWSLIAYLILFQSWTSFVDYPEGVLKETYSAVGIFHLLPGPLSDFWMQIIYYIWPAFLIGSLVPRISRFCLWGSFIFGCYVLGYDYNFGRIFHGTSLVLQVLLVFAIGIPAYRTQTSEKISRTWMTLKAAQLVICLSYFAAGVSKMIRSGWSWAFSQNLAVILHTQALTTPTQQWLLQLPSGLLQAMAVFVLLFELTSLLPWFFPRLRWIYIFAWTMFHVTASLTLGGHTTFFSHLLLYPVFLAALSWKPLRPSPSQFDAKPLPKS